VEVDWRIDGAAKLLRRFDQDRVRFDGVDVTCVPFVGPAAGTHLVFNGSFEYNAIRSDAPDGWTAAGSSAVTVRDIMCNPVDAKVAVLSETPVYLFGPNADLVERALP